MRTLRLTKILEYYDVPQLFLATDQFMSHFICMMTEYSPEKGFIYFAVQVSENKLRDFLKGENNLRELYTCPEVEDAYYQVIVRNQVITAEIFDPNNISEDILPGEGYYYEEDDESEDYELVTKTQLENCTIIRLGFVDQNNSHEIDTDCLSQAISAFQHMVTSCHQKLKGRQNTIEANLKVTTFKAASFDVEFKTSSPLNLFGGSEISQTFLTIDSLMRTDDEDMFKSLLMDVQGRTVSNYKRFIKILVENELSVKYKWVYSLLDREVVSTVVTRDRVEQIYELLTRNEELASEEVDYEGVFLASSVENGKWTLLPEDNDKPINGESENNSLLSGVTIERKQYRIKCRETQVQNVVTLKIENKLILISIAEI